MPTYDSYQDENGETTTDIHRKDGGITSVKHPKGRTAVPGGPTGWQSEKSGAPLLKNTKEHREKTGKSFTGEYEYPQGK